MIASTGWWLSVDLMFFPSSSSTLSYGCFLLDKHLFDDYVFSRCVSDISSCYFFSLMYFCIVHPKLEVLRTPFNLRGTIGDIVQFPISLSILQYKQCVTTPLVGNFYHLYLSILINTKSWLLFSLFFHGCHVS